MSISLSDYPDLPFLGHLADDERERMEQCAYLRRCEKGCLIYSPDQECLGLVMVLRGEVRAVMLSQEGREIVLCRLRQGDTDVLSASCVINQIVTLHGGSCTAESEPHKGSTFTVTIPIVVE